VGPASTVRPCKSSLTAGYIVNNACRVEDQSTSWARFKPAPPGTPFKYQFVPNQTYALYPQLAQATPFFLGVAEVDAIVGIKDSKNNPLFKPPRNDY